MGPVSQQSRSLHLPVDTQTRTFSPAPPDRGVGRLGNTSVRFSRPVLYCWLDGQTQTEKLLVWRLLHQGLTEPECLENSATHSGAPGPEQGLTRGYEYLNT